MAATLAEIDQVLMRYADSMSLNAISFKLGGLLSPEGCGARIVQLLDSPDYLSSAQQDQLVTLKMRQLVVQLEEMMIDKSTARTAEVLGSQLERLGARLDKRMAATEKDLSQLYAFQGGVLLDAVMVAATHLRGAITNGDPVSEEQFDNALESAMRFAQIELSQHELSQPLELTTGADKAGNPDSPDNPDTELSTGLSTSRKKKPVSPHALRSREL